MPTEYRAWMRAMICQLADSWLRGSDLCWRARSLKCVYFPIWLFHDRNRSISLRFAAIHFRISSCVSSSDCTGRGGGGSFAPLRFGRVHLARSFNCAGDLDTEVAQYRRAVRWTSAVLIKDRPEIHFQRRVSDLEDFAFELAEAIGFGDG